MKPSPSIPLINRLNLEKLYGGYVPPSFYNDIPLTPYVPLDISVPSLRPSLLGDENAPMGFEAWSKQRSTENRFEPSTMSSQSYLTDPTGGRFPYYKPGYDNEDAYAQNQGWTTKAFNGITKGLGLAGTTFLQTTVGLVNGLYQMSNTGRAAAFYDNEFNRALDDFNKKLETSLPSYETKEFRDAKWYSPDYLLTGNFLWEGVVKNLGFAAGAAASGLTLSAGISWAGKLANMSRLTAAGRVAEVMQKTKMITDGTQKANQIKSWSDNMISAYKGLSFGEKALVSAFSTTGEAGIEAYHNMNEYRDRVLENFEKEFGRVPNGEELAKINEAADSIGNASMIGNVALLSFTNFIQFPKILGSSYKAEKGVFNEIAKKTSPLIRDGAEYVAKPSRLPGALNTLNKIRPYTFSISEAFEEGSQFAIGKASEDFYDKKYKGEDADWLDSVTEGIKETFTTDEGMKNVLIGGLSGSIMMARGRYRQNFREQQNTDDALRSGKWEGTGLNSAKLSNFISDSYDSVQRSKIIQEEREGYTATGDILNSKDAEADYIINYLAPRMKHGRADLVFADIKDYETLAMSKDGWNELVEKGIALPTDTKESFLNRLGQLRQTAENVKSLYSTLNLQYAGRVNEDGEKIYPDEVIDKMVYAASKIADYDTRINALSSETLSYESDRLIAAAQANDPAPLEEAISKIDKQVENNTLTTSDAEATKQKLKDLSSLAIRRQNFFKEYKAITETPDKFKDRTREAVKDSVPGEIIKIDKQEIVTGTPYYMMDAQKPSKDGVKPRSKPQRVNVLKQNADGTVEIEMENGQIKTMTPEELAAFNLRSIEDIDNNPNAKFVLENMDEVFYHYGKNKYGKKKGKDEDPAEGVLEWNEEDNVVEFVWTTPKGKTYRTEAPQSAFVAKEGTNYKGGMIRKKGETMTEQQQLAEEAFLRSQPSVSERLQRRISVANTLYNNLKKEITTIANKIAANNKKLEILDQEIEQAYLTKDGKPRKRITKKLLTAIDALEKLKETIPVENERLEGQQVLLEGELDSVQDFIDNLNNTSTSNTQLLSDLKEEVSGLKDLISLTKDSIKRAERQLPLIEALYKKALKLLDAFIKGISKANPGIPLSMEEYQANMASRLGEEVAEGIIARNEGFTEQVLDIENTILSYQEDIKFPSMEKKYLSLSRDLKEMQDALKEMEDNYRAKEKILSTFQDFYKEQEGKKKAEEKLKGDAKNQQVADASMEKDGASLSNPVNPPDGYETEYQPSARKSDELVATSSIPKDDGHSWQKRANEFGFKLHNLYKEKKKIVAIYVTKNNEKNVGLTGLIDHMLVGAPDTVKPEEGIATVMVIENEDGSFTPVDVNGDPITGDVIDNGIYQWMPLGNLTNTKGDMFREDTPQEVKDEIISRYKAWRGEILESNEVAYTYKPKSSFGFLQFEEGQETPVADAAFISKDERELSTNPNLINISTTQKELNGNTTSYPNPYKRVLIKVGEEYAQLQNKQHTEEEAKTIFEMIRSLAYEFVEEVDQLKTDRAIRILESLKGKVYWGLPTDKDGKMKNDAPYSGVYFSYEFGEGEFPTLFVGRNPENRFPFTPTTMDLYRDDIEAALTTLYTNTNYKYLRSSRKEGSALTRSYEEIISMKENGEIGETRIWPNYQTYLLSSKNPDGSSRTRIPLTTVANPVTESNPVNRTGIYFFNPSMTRNYTVKRKKQVNLKAEQKKTNTITDNDVIDFVEQQGAEYKALLDKITSPVEKLKQAKILFEQLTITYAAQDKYKNVKNPKKREALVNSAVKAYNDAIAKADVPLDLRVQQTWRDYQAIYNPKPKPTFEDMSMTFDEDGNDFQDGPPPGFVPQESWEQEYGDTEVEPTSETVPANQVGVDVSEEVPEAPAEEEPSLFGTPLPELEFGEDAEPKKEEVRRRGRRGRQRDTRRVVNKDITRTENWPKVEKWLKKNFPNLPFYRLEEVIKNTNGDPFAFGMLADGAIYVWNAAETGTAYHEVFEAVWKMFTPVNEQQVILDEFRARPGTFIERETQNTIEYSKASDAQVKEQLAEEFRDYMLRRSTPFKTAKNFILKLFRDLKKIIRDLFINPKQAMDSLWNITSPGSEVEAVFRKINTGFYAKNSTYARQLSFAQEGFIPLEKVDKIPEDAEFSRTINGMSDAQKNDVVEEMIYVTVRKLLNSKNGLFSLDPVKANDAFLHKSIKAALDNARQDIMDLSEDYVDEDGKLYKAEYTKEERDLELVKLYTLQKAINKNFGALKQLYISRIKRYDIQIDENDMAQIESDEKTRNSDYVDATKVDKFKKMNPALKLLFNTVAIVNEENFEIPSSIGGVKTLPFSTVKNTLMSNLQGAKNPVEMQKQFRDLAKKDPNFRRLYKRFYNSDYTEEGVKFDNINNRQDFRLVSGLWKTFSLFAPTVKNVFILENGDVEVGDANLATEALQLRAEMSNDVIIKAKSVSGLLKYSPKGEVYTVNREKLNKYKNISTDQKAFEFLQDLGISFPGYMIRELRVNKPAFFETVNGLRESLEELTTLKSISSQTLNMHGRLLELALLKTKVTNSEYDTTFFNIVGERTQTYIGGNSPQRLSRALNSIDNIKELDGTEFEYLVPGNDSFTGHSMLVKSMFDEKTGDKRPTQMGEETLATVGYAGGTMNEIKGRKSQSSKLKLRDRVLQEINLNLKGWYMNLVPGDASTEWMTYLGNFISDSMIRRAEAEPDGNRIKLSDQIHDIFKGYFIDEVKLAREGRNVHSRRDSSELRFFKEILSPKTLASIKKSTADPASLYTDTVRKAVEKKVLENKRTLYAYLAKIEAIKKPDDLAVNEFSIENTSIKNVTAGQLEIKMLGLTLNYMVNTIEQHKLVYGDPYQYKDELKRTKSFQSPRQEILNNSDEINAVIDRLYNKKFKEGEIGHTDFLRDFFRTITYNDVEVADELFPLYGKDGVMEETDGGGIIHLNAYRNFKIRSSDWTTSNEIQYEYEVAWEKAHKAGLQKIKDGKLTYEQLMTQLKRLRNPKVKDTFTTLKPVVTGNAYFGDGTFNRTVLDKYSLYPLSYRMMVEMDAKNAVRLYNKMSSEDIDYIIFNSGRKVGAYNTVAPYKDSGEFNNDSYPIEALINIPFSTIGLQTEVPSKDRSDTTRGSQVTKIVTMDRMEAGVPIDWRPDEEFSASKLEDWLALTPKQKEKQSPLYKEIIINRELLRDMIDFGYETLLKKLGIEEDGDSYKIPNYEKTVDLIRNEVLTREANDNIIDALDSFMRSNSVLEATPAYRQISNILYSIVDKNIVHPKISGGMKVQIPSTFFEDKRNAVREINGKPALVSDALGFYTETKDGKSINVMEIYAGRWFPSNMSDTDLLKWLNETPEGQKILEGFAFRIPTQNMNSIDAFRIKKFLPEEFGDNVVVPSALVGKVGSDFDIDKLSMYLKNVISRGYDYSGKPVLVKKYEAGSKGKAQALADAEYYLEKEWDITSKKAAKTSKRASLMADLALGKKLNPKDAARIVRFYKDWFSNELLFDFVPGVNKSDSVIETYEDGEIKPDNVILNYRAIENFYMNKMDKLNKTLDKLDGIELFEAEAEQLADKLYKQGLENAYIESNIRLLTHPTNFKKLTSPNSADKMKELSEEVRKAKYGKGYKATDYSDVGRFLDRMFMTELRHNFVAGKQGIGIAAVGQTNHANNQQQLITIDLDKIAGQPDEENRWLKYNKGQISFRQYNKIKKGNKMVPTLSMIYNKAGEYISDIMGMFIDGYVDISNDAWIMELGATPETTGTWQFLIKLGVPLDDVAWFMNQPIIVDYLQKIENKGYGWLFIDSFVEDLQTGKYSTKVPVSMTKIPSKAALKRTVGKETLSDIEKAEQQFYLQEFLKYAMMARHLYYFTQATNHDTANFNNPYLLTKKERQLDRAKRAIISSPEDMLNTSWLGDLRYVLVEQVRKALGKILISDRKNVNSVVEKALEPYTDLPDKDYVRMSQRIISNVFDYAMQTTYTEGENQVSNNDIYEILIGDRNIARRMYNFLKEAKKKPELAENYVVRMAEIVPSKSAEQGGTDNIRIKAQNTEVYDQNRMIYAFRELRDYLGKDSELYQGLLKLGILQSGLGASALSYTSIIPFEDFERFYNEALQRLETRTDLSMFNTIGAFQRNNWNVSDVVPYVSAPFIPVRNVGYNPGMRKLPDAVKKAITDNKIPQIARLRAEKNTENSHIVYTYDIAPTDLLTEQQQADAKKEEKTLATKAAEVKKEMRDRGDYSYKKKALLERVTDEKGVPYSETTTTKAGKEITYYLFKAVNAWGNGPRANEFYDYGTPSQINNGFIKVKEASNERVLETYLDAKENIDQKRSSSGNQFNFPISSNIVVKTFNQAILRANPNHIFLFGDNTERKGKGGQAVIRDEQNAMGIATKLKPNNNNDAFMTDIMLETNKQTIDEDIEAIKADGRSVVFPADGLGTGRAKLKEKAPKTYAYLKQRLLEEFEYDNDEGQFTYDKRKVKPPNSENTMSLKGTTYKFSEIDSDLLVSLGYDEENMNRILEIVCKPK